MSATLIWQNYFTVASTAFETGNLPTARHMFEAAIQDAGSFGLSHEEAAACHGLALVLVKTGHNEESKRLLRRAVRLYSLFTPIEPRGMAATACVLADLYSMDGADDKALPLLKVAKRAIASQCGELCPELKPLLNRLAMIYARHAQAQKARHLLQQSRQILSA
jgi:tetratricopeptide (TPR) repeat protein